MTESANTFKHTFKEALLASTAIVLILGLPLLLLVFCRLYLNYPKLKGKTTDLQIIQAASIFPVSAGIISLVVYLRSLKYSITVDRDFISFAIDDVVIEKRSVENYSGIKRYPYSHRMVFRSELELPIRLMAPWKIYQLDRYIKSLQHNVIVED